MRLRSERILTPTGTVAGELSIREGRIEAIEPLGERDEVSEPVRNRDDVIDLDRLWVVPGLIDLHVHGGGGAQFNTCDPEEVASAARFHAAHGTTGLLATTVSDSPEQLLDSLRAIGRAIDGPVGPLLLGAHLEGPFVSPCRPGAMERSGTPTRGWRSDCSRPATARCG